jgi:hypothetical protein
LWSIGFRDRSWGTVLSAVPAMMRKGGSLASTSVTAAQLIAPCTQIAVLTSWIAAGHGASPASW